MPLKDKNSTVVT